MGLTVSENVAVKVVPPTRIISVYDSCSLTEDITSLVPFYLLSVNDSATVTESIARTLVCKIKPVTDVGIQLWSKLNSASDVTSPTVGTGGAEVGSPTYVASKFGNGILSDVDDEGCTFPTSDNSINLDKGTIEFWAKLNYAPDDGSYHQFFDFYDGINGGIELEFYKTIDDFQARVYVGGALVVTIYTEGVSWSSGDLLHFAVVWDREGNDIGGGKTLAIYVNNVEEVSSTDTWETDTVNANLYVGIDRNQDAHSDAVIDNLKTLNVCKTDFSNKDVEAGLYGPVESVSLSEFIATTGISNVNVYDSATVTDVDAVQVRAFFSPSVYDSITVTESIATAGVSYLSVYDSITASEYIKTVASLGDISVSDNAVVTEYIKSKLTSFIAESETVTISESITMLRSFPGISVYDAITITEKIWGNMWQERSKETDEWTERTKETDSWTERTKETDEWTERPHKEGA